MHNSRNIEETMNRQTDEITNFLMGRYLSSMEAMWNILGFQSYPSPHPTVNEIKVKLPDDNRLSAAETVVDRTEVPTHNDEHVATSDIMKYFMRPRELEELKCLDLFEQYTIRNTQPRRPQITYFTVRSCVDGKTLYYVQRSTPSYARYRKKMLLF